MVGLMDRLRFGFTDKARKKKLHNLGYRPGTDGKVYRVTGMGIERVGTKKSWF